MEKWQAVDQGTACPASHAVNVISEQIRISAEKTLKGYYLSAFNDAFESYTPFQNETTKQAHSRSDNSHFGNETAKDDVSFPKTKQAHSPNGCFDVSFSVPLGWENRSGEPFEAIDLTDRKPALGPYGDSLDDFQ